MSKILAFINLDWNTQKLYMKQMLILFTMGFLISFVSKTTVSLQMLIGLGALIFVSYPFAISDKTQLDVFYCTLPINRETVVKARYLGGSSMLLIASLIGFVVSLGLNPVLKSDMPIDMQIIILAVLILYLGIMFAVQTPLYFKFGYEKSKLITYFPIIIIALVSGAASFLKGKVTQNIIKVFNEILEKPVMLLAGVLVISLVFIFISYTMSLKIYHKKEF